MDAKRVRATQSFGELPAEAAEQRKVDLAKIMRGHDRGH